jgi:RHS repeat-associated protein
MVTAAVVTTSLIGVAPGRAAVPGVGDDPVAKAQTVPDGVQPVAGTPAAVRARGSDPEESVARRGSPPVVWPAAGAATVTAPARGTVAVTAGEQALADGSALKQVGKLPVRVGSSGAVASSVRVEMLDRAAAERAGVRGVLLRLGHPDGVARKTAVEVDYSGFRNAYGGDYASRLSLVRIPEGAKDPGPTTVRSVNNTRTGRLTAEVTDGLYAVTAAPSGSTGSFQPTSLAPSATWQVGLQSGDFTWSYPMDTPSVPGVEPSVGLSYSSGAVDGRVAGTNNQPSWIGEGFDFQPGFIERSYKACGEDGQPATVTDLCWATNNATVTLPGAAGALVRDDATGVWRVEQDEGWRVELLTGASNGDDNGEHWKLTSPDGTQYFFGLNRLPQWQSGNPETNSAWAAPVFGNQAGEPCYAGSFAASWCQQAYRWSLDYVVDRKGDAMSFWYDRESNYYARNAGTPTAYTRGGYLNRIEYGQRADALFSTPAAARVVFTPADRCAPGTACVQSQPQDWPDTPWDQWCGGATCATASPTFWTTKRLSKVVTQVYTGGTYQSVGSWTLNHSFPVPPDGTSPALWLDSIVHTGHVGGTLSLPPVTFDGSTKANRVDAADARPAMYKRRIQNIFTETGGQISVRYLDEECLPAALPMVDNNDKRCFPAMWGPNDSLNQEFFHKYAVSQVTEIDLVGGNPDEVTTYEYVPGGHSWRHDDAELVPAARKSWGQWRGYQRVRVRAGPPGGAQTLTEHLFLRGMDGDVNQSGAPDTITVDGIADRPIWAGFARTTTEYNGSGGAWTEKTVSVPEAIRRTAVRNRPGLPPLEAYLTDERSEQTLNALADGTTRTTEVTYRYDPTYGTLDSVDDRGDLSTPADDACTTFSYVRNLTDWIVDAESRTEVVSVPCGTTPSYPGDLISDERYFYDGSTTWGTVPTAGNVTRAQTVASWSGGPVYVDTGRVVLDAHGRVVEQYDTLGNKAAATYTPATGGPVTAMTVTNPLGHTSAVSVHPLLGEPVRSVDANNRASETTYDPLGRVLRIWGPGRNRTTQSPSAEFTYTLRADAPSVVATRSLLGNGSGYLTSYAIFDGFLRARQTQAPSPAGGRILTDTRYDAFGRVDRTNTAYWNNGGPPGPTLVDAADAAVPGQTKYVYDAADREVAEIFLSLGAEKWRTSTTYGGNWIAVDPPDGDTATMEIFDADGNTTELRQFAGGAPTGAYDATRYTYTKSGERATVTDPAGNVWRHFYDLRGREVRTEDPDSGTMTSTYDDENRLMSTTDSRGRTLAHSYDALDRKTGLYDGSTAGVKLADWSYDNLAGGKGLPVASTRYVDGQAYRSEVLGYDAAGRATGSALTIPAVEAGLAGRYENRVVYNAAGQVTSDQLPATGDLPAETLQYAYDPALGLPTMLRSTAATYVNSTGYTELAEPKSLTFGATGSAQVIRDFAYEAGTRRVAGTQARTKTAAAAETTVSSVGYSYDPAGNLTRIADQVTADRQCFQYDYLRRLVNAWTPAAADCAAAPVAGALGGPAPYWHSYSYDKVGNRLSEVQHAVTGDTTRTYTYPTAGVAQPHTLRSVTTSGPGGTRTDTYGYDGDGNTTARPGQNLTWDAEGHLATVAEGGNTTSFLYDAEGDRLIRRDPTGATLYLGDTELRRSTGGALTGTRYYGHGGSVVAVRTAGKLTWLVPDHHGTGQLAIDSTTLSVARRYLLPFGAPRGSVPANWPGEKGFVGGTIDPSTGLTHLGAREYDPLIGRFISVDPLIDMDDPQTMHGYAYANNSPATFTDPDGLKASCGHPSQCRKDPPPKKAKPKKAKPQSGHPTMRLKTKKQQDTAAKTYFKKKQQREAKAAKAKKRSSGHPSMRTKTKKQSDQAAKAYFKKKADREAKAAKKRPSVRQADGPDSKILGDAEIAKARDRAATAKTASPKEEGFWDKVGGALNKARRVAADAWNDYGSYVQLAGVVACAIVSAGACGIIGLVGAGLSIATRVSKYIDGPKDLDHKLQLGAGLTIDVLGAFVPGPRIKGVSWSDTPYGRYMSGMKMQGGYWGSGFTLDTMTSDL